MSSAAVTLLRAHLDQLRLGGRTTVPLNAEAREALAKLSGQAPLMRSAAPVPVQGRAGQRAGAYDEFQDAPPLGSLRQALTSGQAPIVASRAPEPTPAPVAPPEAQPAAPAGGWTVIDVPGATLTEKLAQLAAIAEADPAPRALGSLRETMVFAVGSPEARLMFVGEAPGAEEERQREPFVGPAGQLLTKIIENAMGLQRPTMYISNICKFRPSMGEGQGNRNRQPTPEEMEACVRYIQTEIRLIRPTVIVALGATAATGLGLQGAVGRLRSRFHEVDGIPTMVTYHPSYILRQEQEGGGMIARRQVWEDMLMVMEKLGMPISEKQRAFFKPKP
ncbi:MAG: phage polymerase-related protein [Verrucomicrobiaceae bacterium]|nr:phage polymerase-related protein [Verrucomicrobiaceae bacterium]